MVVVLFVIMVIVVVTIIVTGSTCPVRVRELHGYHVHLGASEPTPLLAT